MTRFVLPLALLFVAGMAFAQNPPAAPTKVSGAGMKTADGLTYWDIKECVAIAIGYTRD